MAVVANVRHHANLLVRHLAQLQTKSAKEYNSLYLTILIKERIAKPKAFVGLS